MTTTTSTETTTTTAVVNLVFLGHNLQTADLEATRNSRSLYSINVDFLTFLFCFQLLCEGHYFNIAFVFVARGVAASLRMSSRIFKKFSSSSVFAPYNEGVDMEIITSRPFTIIYLGRPLSYL